MPRSNLVHRAVIAFLGAMLGLAITSTAATAADHRDGPRITDLNSSLSGSLDLNDLYLFVSPTNPNNTVLIQTMSPGAGIVGPAIFFPGAAYDLQISNDGNPLTDEIVFRTVFSAPDQFLRQRYQIFRIDANGSFTMVSSGTTSSAADARRVRSANVRGGGRSAAGIFDDPFFFDVNNTARFNREATLAFTGQPRPADVPAGANPARHFLPPTFPNNFFGGFNTLAIVLEIPRTSIQSSRNNPNITAQIRALADTGDGRGFAQFDRTALPSINTVVTPLTRTISGERPPTPTTASGIPYNQDFFNVISAATDAEFRPLAIQRIMGVFGRSQAQATDLANLFLPDVARFNTTSRSGFPNGRRLPDDVIDIEIQLLTGNALPGDRVVNDSTFQSAFPYIGRPNPVTDTLRSLAARLVRDPEADVQP